MTDDIQAKTKSIRQLLRNKKYNIHDYQREYRWEKAQIEELIGDLTDSFRESYDKKHEREQTVSYKPYFLGSIIISARQEKGTPVNYIVDGQQRLTSLTLLLIFLYHKLDKADQERLKPLICAIEPEKHSYNLAIPERQKFMASIFEKKTYPESEEKKNPSIKNLQGRYDEIEENFPEDLVKEKKALASFTNWFINRVVMIKIITNSDDDAYNIFETMNDRGLSLTPTEMLKGYLLTNITDTDLREEAHKDWKTAVRKLQNLGEENIEARCVNAWLRGRYARSIRSKQKGSKKKDFELIDQCHRYVRDKKISRHLGLKGSQNFADFISYDFKFYSECYKRIYQLTQNYDPKFISVYANSLLYNLPQFRVLLAALNPKDKEKEIECKIRIVSTYIDILLARRIWNQKFITDNSLRDHMFKDVILKIRKKSPTKIIQHLKKNLDEKKQMIPPFSENTDFGLQKNYSPRNRIHWFLARITDYIETQSSYKSQFSYYMNKDKSIPSKNHFQIEHILAPKSPDRRNFPKREFEKSRQRIGALVLLPANINKRLGNKGYKIKKRKYLDENLLAKSLHKDAYKKKSKFRCFLDSEPKLGFKAYDEFTPKILEKRCELYRQIAMRLWDPEQLLKIAEEG